MNDRTGLLIEALHRHTLALFIGADLPREVTGLPSRVDLAHGLAHRRELDTTLSLAEVSQRVAQASNRWEFTAFIRDALDTAGRSPQPFHRRIVELVKTHRIETLITTAYDNLLELAFREAGVPFNRVVRSSDVSFINSDRPMLIRLYGDAQQPDTLVVTDRDHSALLRDRDKEDLVDEVKRAFRRNTVLFVGYNLADPDFRFLFDQIVESRFARTAYAVWPGLPEADVRMWRDRGIVILDTDPLGIMSGTVAQPVLRSRSEATVTVTEVLPLPESGDSHAVVALDVRHGARIGQAFEGELKNCGCVVKHLSTPLTTNSLSEVRVLILFISLPDYADQPLLPEELAFIHSFVAHGGSLFLIGLGWVWKQYGQKHGLTMDDYPLNKIAHHHYGIYFRGEDLPCARLDATSMGEHPICKGLRTIASFGMSSTLELQVESPAVPLIWDGDDTDRCILAAWDGQEQGRVVCLQHEGYFSHQDVNKDGTPNIYEFDNRQLLLNIVQWLSQYDRSSSLEQLSEPTLDTVQPSDTVPKPGIVLTRPALSLYHDLEILIGDRRRRRYPIHVITSPAGQGEGVFILPFAEDELQDALDRMEREDTDEAFLADFGTRLFTALFTGDVRARYAESAGSTGADAGLRVRLRLDPPELQELPWELIRDPEKREFLVLSKRSLVTRYLHVPRPTPPPDVEPPLRVLVLVAAPRGLVPLDADDEVARIRRALRPLLDEGVVNLSVESHGTKRGLRQRLLDDAPHILHYIGHGDLADDRGVLLLEDGKGCADRLDGPTLGTLLKGSRVRLAVLNACLSARDPALPDASAFRGRRAAFMGVGPALVDAGLGAVVAMQFSMADESARVFAEDFYAMLARFKPVDECVSRAREALLLKVGSSRRDWATPVLFMRAPDGVLFSKGR